MKFFNKWRFLIIKLICKTLIRYQWRTDYWVQISDKRILNRSFKMKSCQFKDQIACNVLKHGWRQYEAPMGLIVASLSKYLPIKFIDIGANTGFYSLIAFAGGAKSVVAYEPVPSIFKILSENVLHSGFQINLRQEAIAERDGRLTIYLPKTDNKYIETSASLNADFRDQHAESVDIDVTSLDGLIDWQTFNQANDNIFLVKIDVESYELPVISGGARFFHDIQPIVMIELLRDNLDRKKIYDLICSYGYQAFSLLPSAMKRLSKIDTDSASDNYLFVPIGRLSLITDVLGTKAGLSILDESVRLSS